MKEQDNRELIVSTCRQLLEEGLLVRTWGNVSCRLEEDQMLITPSGRDYETMKPEDLPVVNLSDGEWTGPYKPSGEKGVHRAAYEAFPEANFVIHTHQTYASAVAVFGIAELEITPEEHRKLGGLAQAGYGLPGMKKLKKEVQIAMENGAHTVLMSNHGVVIAAESCEEALYRARLLEEICRRWVKGTDPESAQKTYNKERKNKIERYLRHRFDHLACVTTDAVQLQAGENKEIQAQLDDMAQMIGSKIPVAHTIRQVRKALTKQHAVLVPGVGGFVSGTDADDTIALAALMEKAAIAARHTQALEADVAISRLDCTVMHLVYMKKYSKQKNA